MVTGLPYLEILWLSMYDDVSGAFALYLWLILSPSDTTQSGQSPHFPQAPHTFTNYTASFLTRNMDTSWHHCYRDQSAKSKFMFLNYWDLETWLEEVDTYGVGLGSGVRHVSSCCRIWVGAVEVWIRRGIKETSISIWRADETDRTKAVLAVGFNFPLVLAIVPPHHELRVREGDEWKAFFEFLEVIAVCLLANGYHLYIDTELWTSEKWASHQPLRLLQCSMKWPSPIWIIYYIYCRSLLWYLQHITLTDNTIHSSTSPTASLFPVVV